MVDTSWARARCNPSHAQLGSITEGFHGFCPAASWPCAPASPPPAVSPVALQSGVYVEGTELEGLHREVLVRAVRHLEQQDRAKLFKGAAGDDEGIKFFAN